MPEAALERRIGYAFRLADGQPVYREIHEPVVRNGQLVGDRVTYRAPDDAVLARKRVDFGADALAPSFRLRDRRLGYVEGLRRSGDGAITLFRRDHAEAPMEETTLQPPAGLVADAGFDRMIFRHFDELRSGEVLSFPFAVPGRLETIDFMVRLRERRQVLGEPALVMRMALDSALFGWLVDPIDVAYHAETGALLRYEGVSNLPRPDGDGNYRVRIDFHPRAADRFGRPR
ncbi:MAG: hypothetical protein WD382_04275 [Halofilum sp. (in: g-proteobacteria)]